MRIVRIVSFAFLAACSTSAAWAQYGLYGSPETLSVPQQGATPAPAATANYPTTTPMAQPAPGPAYAPAQPQYGYSAQPQYGYPAQPQYGYPAQPQYRYPAQPQYRYPAQPSATAAYQPYQPGAQYQYPAPYGRPPVRTAAVEQPMMVQPTPAAPAPPVATGGPVPTVAPAPQGSGMMNQMLAEQGYGGCYGCENGGAYRGAVGRYEQAACGPCAEGAGYDGYCGQGAYCPWYGSVMALVMGRTDGRRFWTSYLDGHPETQLANNQVGMAWQWGGEARFGHRFCCNCTPCALEATFWSTAAMTGSQTTSVTGGLVSTPLQTDNVFFYDRNVGPQATDFFNGATSHTVARRDEFYNFEINLVRDQFACACDSPWDIGWSVGVRYFRFEESLSVSAVNANVGGLLGPGDAYFRDDATNNLIGLQFGFDAAYNVGNCVRLFITPKVGIYDNILNSNFDARARVNALGGGYVDGLIPASIGYSDFPAHGSNNGIAFLTQIDLGADWQFTRNWSARVGYRVVAITGMGLADDQFPQYLVDTPEMGNPQHMSSLVLHGAFLGATYCF
jgi:hypothetical protein